jgi:beta-lactam-binding protein with PASTA domain
MPVVERREWSSDDVLVPDVTGLVVDDARQVASDAGVVLAQPDPDGPPLAALTWQQPVVVTSQNPAAGTAVRRWQSVVVTWKSEPSSVREPRRPLPTTLAGRAETSHPELPD